MPATPLVTLGYQLFTSVFTPNQVQRCLELLPSQPNLRHVLEKVPALQDELLPLHNLATDLCGGPIQLCRSILFDKVPGANWKVAWHQDVTLACALPFDWPGWGPWSVKEGVPHVQPPTEVLTQMLTLRLHLDDCGPENGPLRVLPGSHHQRLSPARLKDAVETIPPVECVARAGDVLAMKPLIVHASSASRQPSHRRVLHLEYAPLGSLPDALRVFASCHGPSGSPES